MRAEQPSYNWSYVLRVTDVIDVEIHTQETVDRQKRDNQGDDAIFERSSRITRIPLPPRKRENVFSQQGALAPSNTDKIEQSTLIGYGMVPTLEQRDAEVGKVSEYADEIDKHKKRKAGTSPSSLKESGEWKLSRTLTSTEEKVRKLAVFVNSNKSVHREVNSMTQELQGIIKK